MRCPNCDRLSTSVLKTIIPVDENIDNIKWRRRKCSNCKHDFKTFEITEEEFRKLHPHKIYESRTTLQSVKFKKKKG